MQIVTTNCPACGGSYGGVITGRLITCEYCGTRFALSPEELQAFGISETDQVAPSEQKQSRAKARQAERDAANTDPMPEFAAMVCEEFKKKGVSASSFKSSPKIVDGLGVGNTEVYLIHDDTMFKSGKNGFAITSEGFFCREMGERTATYTSWQDFAENDEPEIDDSYIRQDGAALCYFSDSTDTLEDYLIELYLRLYRHAQAVM